METATTPREPRDRRRRLARIVGEEFADLTLINETRMRIALGILRRGFLGRLRWLLFGS